MKKLSNKELMMNKEDNGDFKNSTKCWICDNVYVDNGVKVRDHCHITEKNRGSAHRDCDINLKLNHNLKKYDSHFVMQELGKFNPNINVLPNGLEIPALLSITKSRFIDSFQFLSSSLDRLVKNVRKNHVKYLGQEPDNKALNLVKQKGFYP